MTEKELKIKATESDGLSPRCSNCCFRKIMVGPNMEVSEICKVCSKSYHEGYIKGFKACRRKSRKGGEDGIICNIGNRR